MNTFCTWLNVKKWLFTFNLVVAFVSGALICFISDEYKLLLLAISMAPSLQVQLSNADESGGGIPHAVKVLPKIILAGLVNFVLLAIGTCVGYSLQGKSL